MRARASEDFGCFCRSVLKDETVPRGETVRRRIMLAPHQLEWLDHLERCQAAGKWAGILAPPASGKSQLWAVGYPLFRLGQQATCRAALCTSAKDMAKKRVRPAKEYVEKDADFRDVFPDCAPEAPENWTAQEFSVRRPSGIKDPSYIGCGIEKPPQGARVEVLINDDICTYDNTISEPAMRQKVIDLWDNGFDTRLGPGSFCVHIGGIIHNRDLNNKLIGDDRFWFIKQAVGGDFQHLVQEDLRTGEIKHLPLWGRAWTPEFLETKYRNNPRAFQRAYRHVGYSDDERTFGASVVRKIVKPTDGPLPGAGMLPCFAGVDLAGRNRPGNAIVIVGLVGGRRVFLHVEAANWTSPQTAQKIAELHAIFKPAMWTVENNAYQQALIDWMKAAGFANIPIEPFTTGKQKADEELGLPGLAAEFDRGLWELPVPINHVTIGCPCGRCRLLHELEEHPFSTSDAIMATWFARHGIMKFGFATEMSWREGAKLGRPDGNRVSISGRRGHGESRLARFRQSRKTTT